MKKYVPWLIITLLSLLPAMTWFPYADTTEARYGAIAQLMMERGDWITPWFDPNTPFWGKPPLSFWAQALSMKVFGATEWAGRFPSWICLLACITLLYSTVKTIAHQKLALISVLIYGSMTLVYIMGLGVLTDPYLNVATLLCLCAWIRIVHQIEHPASPPKSTSHLWGYLWFVGISLGLLAKGPLTLVLVLPPMICWILLHWKQRIQYLKALPWLWGSLLTAVLVLPWYILAELKTPGFLSYFIVGEHILRYIDPGWAGDLYGTAHKYPHGTIWFFLLQAAAPWSLVLLGFILLYPLSKGARSAWQSHYQTPYLSLWWAYALWLPIFFTAASNILWTYLLPALPALSVCITSLIAPTWDSATSKLRGLRFIVWLMPIFGLIFTLAVTLNPNLIKSEKQLIQSWQSLNRTCELVYIGETPFSARFYSHESVHSMTELNTPSLTYGNSVPRQCYAVSRQDKDSQQYLLSQGYQQHFENRRYRLFVPHPH